MSEDLLAELAREGARAEEEIRAAKSPAEIEKARVFWLGSKGVLTLMARRIGTLPAEERPGAGAKINASKAAVEKLLQERKERVSKAAAEETPRLDVTRPGIRPERGREHPIAQTAGEIVRVFRQLGFEVAGGPEVEEEFYNFDALNIPRDHPARDLSDNFYLENGLPMRSQTSTIQIRTMRGRTPPFRFCAVGKVFRPDTVDATHHFQFMQVEGFVADEGVSFSDLKTVLIHFARGLFGADAKIRLRPWYFPFTEPSAEMDFSCPFCKGRGCSVCKQSGWIEMGGCGMIDPNVFAAVGIDSERYTGFAFGLGVDRLAMLRHRVDDIRLFTENDVRFLRQF